MTTIPTSRFYVYELQYPNGTTFYVGKGSGTRVFQHLHEAFGKCGCKKCQVIHGIWQGGEEVRTVIVFECETEEEAYSAEHDRISRYGLENLTNANYGWGPPKPPSPPAILLHPRKKRKNGTGTIFRRSDGRWCGALRVWTKDGKTKRQTVYGKSPEEVRDKLIELHRTRGYGQQIHEKHFAATPVAAKGRETA